MRSIILLFICAFMFSSRSWALPEYIRNPGPVELPAKRSEATLASMSGFHRYYYVFGGGAAFPSAGHWGDKDVGFRLSPVFTVAGAKKVDETLSYGIETFYSSGHRNRSIPEMKVRIFSFTPFLRVVSQGSKKAYYGILGAGIYHWNQPSFNAEGNEFTADSGSSFGVNMGGGIVCPFWSTVQLCLDLRWHHIFTMKGKNFDLDPLNNLVSSVSLVYGFF